MINWDDYRVFLEVARLGGLTGAASELKMDPATVGRRIARLEDNLGAKLFLKMPRGYEMTQAGEQLFERIAKMEGFARSAQGAVEEKETRLVGTVRLGATDGLANYVLPKVVCEIRKSYPDLFVQILTLPPVFNLNKRDADLAILVTPPKTRRLIHSKICDYSLHMAASKGYLEDNPKIMSKADLKGHSIIGYIPDLIYDPSVDFSQEITPNRTAELSSNSVSVQTQMVSNGGGVSLMHDFVVASHSGLAQFLKSEISVRKSFYMTRLKEDESNRRLSKIAKLFSLGVGREIARLENMILD